MLSYDGVFGDGWIIFLRIGNNEIMNALGAWDAWIMRCLERVFFSQLIFISASSLCIHS